MVRHGVLETQSTEPAIRQIEVDLFAQPALGTNAEAVTDDQHSNLGAADWRSSSLRHSEMNIHIVKSGPTAQHGYRCEIELSVSVATQEGKDMFKHIMKITTAVALAFVLNSIAYSQGRWDF